MRTTFFSRPILKTRPINKWLISRYKHASFTKFQKSWCWLVDEKTNVWIKLRETHFENVLTFFKDKPNQLLIINIEKDGWENVVSTFLQKNYRRVDNRRVEKSFRNIISADNIDVDKMKIINNNVTTCLQNNGYTGNELLLKNTDLSEYGYVTFL